MVKLSLSVAAAIALAAAAFVPSISARAQVRSQVSALQVFGSGEQTCADWNAAALARTDNYAVMESWLLGYISGGIVAYAQRADAPPLRPRGVEEVPGLLEGGQLTRPSYRTQRWDATSLVALASQQCASMPNQSLSMVADSILKHLTRQGPPISK